MPSGNHNLLVFEVECTRQVTLAASIARTRTRAPDLLPTTSFATALGVIDEPASCDIKPSLSPSSSTITHALDDRFIALLVEGVGFGGGFGGAAAASPPERASLFSLGGMMSDNIYLHAPFVAKPESHREGVSRMKDDLFECCDPRTAFNGRNNGIILANLGHSADVTDEFGSQNSFVAERLAFGQQSPLVKHRQPAHVPVDKRSARMAKTPLSTKTAEVVPPRTVDEETAAAKNEQPLFHDLGVVSARRIRIGPAGRSLAESFIYYPLIDLDPLASWGPCSLDSPITTHNARCAFLPIILHTMLDEEKAAPPKIGNNSSGNSSSENLQETKPRSSFLSKFSEDLDPRFVYLPLLVCCFATGLTDGTLYNAYGTFVSMQTGELSLLKQ
ncbi:hypothetical protein NUW58_g3118 [Xylaria curta]|uniref:Uncharacterized protein n=1 Tax=Xylaria curta TaxID=42375 RepID=A0ACC1PDZ5_9PEZI|nr:hypothetical protein NUW58_g3118 [Xylaria curta]